MAGEKWKIGGVTVTRIVEIEMSGGLSRFLPDATREARSIGCNRISLMRMDACAAQSTP